MSHEKENLLRQITILDFAAIDLQLFLNNHPTNAEALEMYNDCVANAHVARNHYEIQFGPLTGFRSSSPDSWTWSDEPWPWQPEANFKIMETQGEAC